MSPEGLAPGPSELFPSGGSGGSPEGLAPWPSELFPSGGSEGLSPEPPSPPPVPDEALDISFSVYCSNV